MDNINEEELVITKSISNCHYGSFKSYPAFCKNFSRSISSQQLSLAANIRHPNFPIFYGSINSEKLVQDASFVTVTELLEGCVTSLTTKSTLATRMEWAKDASLGMTWLHCNNPPIIVKTLKPSNLLYDNMNRVRVNWINEYITNCLRTEPFEGSVYFAPEVINNQLITEKSDVYSFGVILLEFLLNETPSRYLCENPSTIKFGSSCPSPLKDLILGCLNENPSRRPSFPLIDERMTEIINTCRSLEDDEKLKRYFDDDDAARFWQSNFSRSRVVEWSTFYFAFYSHFQLPHPILDDTKQIKTNLTSSTGIPSDLTTCHDLSFLCLKEFLVSSVSSPLQPQPQSQLHHQNDEVVSGTTMTNLQNNTEVVTIEKFAKFIKLFGPFSDHILQHVETSFANMWFSHDITSTGTEKVLFPHKNTPGSFIVRLSASSPGSFCVSYVNTKSQVIHILIPHSSQGLKYSNQYFSSVNSLVDHLTSVSLISHPVSVSKLNCHLG